MNIASCQGLSEAIRNHQPLPAFPQGLTLEQAYQLLPEVAAGVCDVAPRGIKAGLTNPDIQAFLGLDHALLGHLYDWGEHSGDTPLALRAGSQLECEVAIVLDADGRPKAIAPAIEIVYLNFAVPEDMNAANLVVSSLGADRYMLGRQLPWDSVDMAALAASTICAVHNGETILETSAMDSLGGPVDALAWCVGEARKRALRIEEDTLLLCGTCGSGLPMAEGEYRVDYGPLGTLEFTVAA